MGRGCTSAADTLYTLAGQILRMTLYILSSCRVSPQNEFLNADATQIAGHKTLNTGSSCKVSPQNEFLNVLATQINR